MLVAGIAACLSAAPTYGAADDWFPLSVEVHSEPFDFRSVRKSVDYRPLVKASRAWRICAPIPHLADTFWTSVNYGLVAESERLGVGLRMPVAGSYERLDRQREQIRECLEDGVDAFVIGAISATGLNDLIEEIRDKGIPVVDLINGIDSKRLSARAAASYRDTAALTGRHLVEHLAPLNRPVRIAWFPGPHDAKWAIDANLGLREGLVGISYELVATVFGNTSQASQTALIKQVLEAHGSVDFIIGSSSTAVAGARVVRDLDVSTSLAPKGYQPVFRVNWTTSGE